MTTPLLRRRDLNRVALAMALGALALPRASRAQQGVGATRWPSDPFALGVASGQPRADSIVLWTRLAPSGDDEETRAARPACAVRWELYADAALRVRVQQGEVIADARRAHAVHVTVQGLLPARTYWYRFVCGDAVSPVGRTRTAPAVDANVARLRIALASCQNYEHGFYAAHRDIARSEIDLVMFVGDYIYEGSNPQAAVRPHGTPTPHTLAQYRERHALYKRDPDLQAAHAAHPWLMTWDDHEVVNDYAGEFDPSWNNERFARRRAAAYRAYFEHQPIALGPEGASMRLHDRFAWGKLADIWMLDGRQYRSQHACADPQFTDNGRIVNTNACTALADPNRSMWGREQEAWLAQGMAGSARQWKLLGQSTQMSSTGADAPEGRTVWTDGWDGYPMARQRLLQGVRDAGLRDVVALGGDVHRHVAADLRAVPNDAASPVVASEFVVTSISSRGGSPALMQQIMKNNPDVKHARGDERGWALIDVTPASMRCEFRGTPHPEQADAQLSKQASYVVEPGRAGVVAS
jgi:alkaline phosphatase D